ncbi:MAG: phosphate-starvation-inducible PsiE family protein [Timaviella obliquedivisa GSE-PSE-MK23-08B]|jgi:uncharacterized membrane protein (DUF373 family)|nr:phosphate-starvation-inducible PsiE family protein [Timaviella obliquedivisa GSE-PSE-MK23-08B]
MRFFQNFFTSVRAAGSDESFLAALREVEKWVSKILSIAMVGVLLTTVVELFLFLIKEIIFNDSFTEPDKLFSVTIIEIFGLFLNVLIALEVLENITAYLKNHTVQLELVVVTSLTAVARKIIIFDFAKDNGFQLIALATAIFALSISYWIVRRATRHS